VWAVAYLRARRRVFGTAGRAQPQHRGIVIATRKAQRLAGESVREIGILLLVFGPLDAFFEPSRPGDLFLALVIGGGLCCVALGIIVEAWTRA